MTSTLYSYINRQNLELQVAIQHCQPCLERAIGLFYSSQACRLGLLRPDGTVTDAQHHPLSLSQYFEARIFNPTCELRWLNRDAGKGQMVVLSDKKLNLNQPHLTLSKYEIEKHLYQTYLLWGKAVPNAKTKDGWQRLTESRIGKLDVPIGTALNPNQRVYLRSQEYLAPVDDFGNVAVIEERLVKLEVK